MKKGEIKPAPRSDPSGTFFQFGRQTGGKPAFFSPALNRSPARESVIQRSPEESAPESHPPTAAPSAETPVATPARIRELPWSRLPPHFPQRGQSPTFDRLVSTMQSMRVRLAIDDSPQRDIEASYDPFQNAIFAPASLFSNTRAASASIRTLAHEMQHAIQNRELAATVATPSERRATQLRGVAAMTEEAFVAAYVGREWEAERVAWQVDMELLNDFQRTRRQRPFDQEQVRYIVEQRLEQYQQQTREFYERKAREMYRRAISDTAGRQPGK